MPYFLVDDENIYDRLRAPKFHLVVFAKVKDDYRYLRQELEAEYGEWLDFLFIDLSSEIEAIFGCDRPFIVLLRPDNYIALLSTDLPI